MTYRDSTGRPDAPATGADAFLLMKYADCMSTYMETPNNPRVNWKSVFPVLYSLGV